MRSRSKEDDPLQREVRSVHVFSSVLGLALSEPLTTELQLSDCIPEASPQFREAALCVAQVLLQFPGYVCDNPGALFDARPCSFVVVKLSTAWSSISLFELVTILH